MEETFKARYIDPMIDWSFKRLFGSEVNKDILIEFLKVIFPEFDIKDITYLPSEQLGIMEKDRRAVFDVICRASDGKEFLVEVQRSLDLWDRTWSSLPLTAVRVYAGARSLDLAQWLTRELGQAVAPLDVTSFFSGLEAGTEGDIDACWPLLGLLMRTDSRKL